MEHLDWPTGIRSLRQLIADRTGLVWPSFACRFFVRMRGAEADCIIGNFQGMVVDRPTELDLVIERPTVLQGFLTRDDMLTMLDRWEQRASFTIGEWVISPPSVTRVGLDPDALPQNYAPLLEPLPAHGSIYRMHRLWGGGETDNDAGNEIADAAFELGLRSEQLLEQYLGISTSPVVSYLMIQLPIPVALDTGYDMSNREVTASVFYRKPYQPSDFWVRMGARWSVSLPLLTVSEEADVGNGWRCATVSHQLDTATGGVQVWAGWSSEPTQFRWTSGRSLGEPITPATRRRDFLSPFYALSRQPLSNHIANAETLAFGGSQGKSTSAAAFETAIANACGALGYAVLFGGTTLQTQGVDLVAFRADGSVAYAISITVSNDLREKIEQLGLVRQRILKALESAWSVKLVLITGQPASSIVLSDWRMVAEEGVLLLTLDDLQGLREQPPDLDGFAATLQRQVPHPTTRLLL